MQLGGQVDAITRRRRPCFIAELIDMGDTRKVDGLLAIGYWLHDFYSEHAEALRMAKLAHSLPSE